MNRFIESIALYDGVLRNLELHQDRLEETYFAHFGEPGEIDLANELRRFTLPTAGVYKIRVTYSTTLESIEIEAYTRPVVQQVMLVQADGLDYNYKYAERLKLEALCHDIPTGTQPVLVQHGYLTDAIYANVCLYDKGDGVWLTPKYPLLKGTARRSAIAAGQVKPAQIHANDFYAGKYSKLKLINCMTLFHEAQEITF